MYIHKMKTIVTFYNFNMHIKWKSKHKLNRKYIL